MSKARITKNRTNVKGMPVYSGGKIVGKVSGDTFKKSITGSKHILHTPHAIAISNDALYMAEQAGAIKIQVTDKESGWIYSSTMKHFKDKGIRIERGYGIQTALPLEGWTKTRKGGAVQAPLFAGV